MLRFVFAVVLLQAFAASFSAGFLASPVVSKQAIIDAKSYRSLETQLFSEMEKDLVDEFAEAPPPRITALGLVRDTLIFFSEVYSFLLISFGIYSAFGILLNISGYGYQFTKDGFRVDTIEHMRMENQMEQEYVRMGEQHKPPSSLPR